MSKSTNSTSLKDRITIRQKTGDDATTGNPIYGDVLTCYAQVKDRNAGEGFLSAQGQRKSSARTNFIVRRTAKTEVINPTMIVLWHSFNHNILSVAFDDNMQFLTIETVRNYEQSV